MSLIFVSHFWGPDQTVPETTSHPWCCRVICMTNAVESLHMTLRKVTKNRGSFPNEEAALSHFSLRWEDQIEAATR